MTIGEQHLIFEPLVLNIRCFLIPKILGFNGGLGVLLYKVYTIHFFEKMLILTPKQKKL